MKELDTVHSMHAQKHVTDKIRIDGFVLPNECLKKLTEDLFFVAFDKFDQTDGRDKQWKKFELMLGKRE